MAAPITRALCSRTEARSSNGADDDDNAENEDEACSGSQSKVSEASEGDVGSMCDGAAAAMRCESDGRPDGNGNDNDGKDDDDDDDGLT